jgi:hypothetical protein
VGLTTCGLHERVATRSRAAWGWLGPTAGVRPRALSQIFVCRRCEVSEPCQGGRLGGEGIELFGRGKALVFDFNHHLPFLDHVHELNTGQRRLCGVE